MIGAKCEVLVPETLQEGSLFYGSGPDVKRRVQADKPSVILLIINFPNNYFQLIYLSF